MKDKQPMTLRERLNRLFALGGGTDVDHAVKFYRNRDIMRALERIERKQDAFAKHVGLELDKTEMKMTQLGQDLTDAVSEIATAVSTADAAIQKEIAALVAAQSANDTAATQAAIGNLKTLSGTLNADVKEMADSIASAAPAATAPAATAPASSTDPSAPAKATPITTPDAQANPPATPAG